MKKLLFIILMTTFLAMPAMAEIEYNKCFNSIDTDYDGEMTKAEFETAFPGSASAVYQAADGDKNGTVSHEEWEDFKASQGLEEGEGHSDS